MAPRKRSAALANTTAVFRVRHRDIDRVLRCAAKTNSPPSTGRHHFLPNDLKGLVWDMDEDIPLAERFKMIARLLSGPRRDIQPSVRHDAR